MGSYDTILKILSNPKFWRRLQRMSFFMIFFQCNDSLRSFFGSANFFLCFVASTEHALYSCFLLKYKLCICWTFAIFCIYHFLYHDFYIYVPFYCILTGCQVRSSHLEWISTAPWWQQADLLRLISSLILTTSRVVYNSASTWKW